LCLEFFVLQKKTNSLFPFYQNSFSRTKSQQPHLFRWLNSLSLKRVLGNFALTGN